MNSSSSTRKRIKIQGAVQGVGFRPFIYRLAHEFNLVGWIINSPSGVELEVQGKEEDTQAFTQAIPAKTPPLALIKSMKAATIQPLSEEEKETWFEIRPSRREGGLSALVLPDVATCEDCLQDIKSPQNRRYRYPFTNCTNCGPRYSIIERLPYDRPFTAMKHFPMCPDCKREYEDPLDRRFHAQPNACPVCGPHLELWDPHGQVLASYEDALVKALDVLHGGQILAVKGLGGFQLMVDATSEKAVERLRQRKGRRGKPFAMMAPDIQTLEQLLPLTDVEKSWLRSPQSPIVLVEKKGRDISSLAPGVSQDTPTLGFMLPYTPLHHLLMNEWNGILIATSGNLSEEPICIDESDALNRLGNIADFFLVHNRPIVRPVDDSVIRVIREQEMMIRRARGFAPFPVEVPGVRPNCLAVGAHLKNSIALSMHDSIFISQHIGDLENTATMDCFETTIRDLSDMYQFKPESTMSDLHPDYGSSRYAELSSLHLQLQHHYAHVLSCMADNGIDDEVLGVSWDGTGLGTDQTIWGGEFLRCTRQSWFRIAHLRPFLLPGGDRAAKEPRRTALSLLTQAMESDTPSHFADFSSEERSILLQMLAKGTQCVQTTSAGRLFDGFASLLGLCHINTHEGKAPQALEWQATKGKPSILLEIPLTSNNDSWELDWRPAVRALAENRQKASVCDMARSIHLALANSIVALASKTDCRKVCLTGGCFQNRLLTELCLDLLEKEGFRVFIHRQIPPNDGGISAGQLYAIP